MKEEMGQLGVVKADWTFEIAITQKLQKGDVMSTNIKIDTFQVDLPSCPAVSWASPELL